MNSQPTHSDHGFRILAWNIRHGGGKDRLPRIIDRIASYAPDVVVITEYRQGKTGGQLTGALCGLGLPCQFAVPADPLVNGVLIASRRPFDQSESLVPDMGEPHRLPVIRTSGITVVGAYFPQREAKRPYWAAVAGSARRMIDQPALIIGDFNTGRHFIDEAGKTLEVAEGMDWMNDAGFIDLWRHRNPDGREYTWYSDKGNGFRIDHAFASPALAARVVNVGYSHQERLDRISDHSALIVDIGGIEA